MKDGVEASGRDGMHTLPASRLVVRRSASAGLGGRRYDSEGYNGRHGGVLYLYRSGNVLHLPHGRQCSGSMSVIAA